VCCVAATHNAYRNHPTRYLIVKDPGRRGDPARPAGRAVVSLGKLPAPAHSVNLFSLDFAPPLRPDRVPVSRTRRSVSTRPRPARQHFFFNLVRVACAPRPVHAPVSRSGVGLSTRSLPARQHFFSGILEAPLPLESRRRFPAGEPHCLAGPAVPVNTFFQLLPNRQRGPARVPVSRSRRAASTPRPRTRQHVFSSSRFRHRFDPKKSSLRRRGRGYLRPAPSPVNRDVPLSRTLFPIPYRAPPARPGVASSLSPLAPALARVLQYLPASGKVFPLRRRLRDTATRLVASPVRPKALAKTLDAVRRGPKAAVRTAPPV